MTDALPSSHEVFDPSCVDCDFGLTIEGDPDEVLEVIDDHQEELELDQGKHFVEFTVRR